MAPSPSTPTRQPANRRGANSTPARRPTLADAFHGRSTTRRRNSNDLHDRAAVAAELRRENTKLKGQTEPAVTSAASNTVQDRIRKWQSQGGGVVEQPVPTVYSPEPTPAVSEVSTEKDKTDDIQLGDTANRRRKRRSKEAEPDEVPERAESKSSSNAPKKRVVSDSAWQKKGKATPKSTPGKEIRVGNGNRTTPTRGSSSRNKPRRNVKDLQYESRKGGHEGTRVYGTPEKESENLKPEAADLRRSSGSRSAQTSDEDRPSSRTTPTPPRGAEGKNSRDPKGSFKMSGGLGGDDVARRRRQSYQMKKTPEKSPKVSPKTSDERQKRRSSIPKVNILKEVYGEGKKMFSRPEPPPPGPVPGNRIEAWLVGTPDPFVDGQPPILAETIEPPSQQRAKDGPYSKVDKAEKKPSPGGSVRQKPSRKRNSIERRTSARDSPPRGPDTIDKDAKPSPRRRKSEDQKSPKNVVADAPSLSSPTLKRAGARRGVSSPPRQKEAASTPERSAHGVDHADSPQDATRHRSVDGSDLERTPRPKRAMPMTGDHELSTIASMETLSTAKRAETISDASGPSSNGAANNERKEQPATASHDSFDPDHVPDLGKKTSLKRRLTTHADLMSVLSLPQGESKSIRSARSLRTNRSKLATATMEDLLQELATDESKYMRELNTLVDGVIPVLLSSVLSKSDSAVAAGLFSSSADPNDPKVTRPIVDMGIALERLKSLHKKVPLQSVDQLLSWAHRGHRAYSEYIKCYRMGFQDVVVNLAPGVEGETEHDEGLPRNAEGDVVNGDGERVDVAFLLKRPLVRLKYLAKTLRGINHVKPSAFADEAAARFQGLVADARRRSNEEKARLEDEAAANIDPTRARDLRTLAALADVSITHNYRVKARDVFSLSLQHTSGQRVDCKVELLLRDDPSTGAVDGDMLICEVDSTGRWLLLPPFPCGRISARNGDRQGEIVVMIRGSHGSSQEWHELLVLHSDDEQAGFEWVQMLGLTPVPPKVTRQSSFISKNRQLPAPTTESPASPGKEKTVDKSRTPSPTEIEVPIGEAASSISRAPRDDRREIYHTPRKPVRKEVGSGARDKDSPSATIRRKAAPVDDPYEGSPARDAGHVHDHDQPRTPDSLNDAVTPSGDRCGPSAKKNKDNRRSRHLPESPEAPKSKLTGYLGSWFKSGSSPKAEFSPHEEHQGQHGRAPDWHGRDSPKARREPLDDHDVAHGFEKGPEASHDKSEQDSFRPPLHQRTSSVPSDELPTIHKLRKSTPQTPTKSASGQDESPEREGSPASPGTKSSPNVLRKRSPPSKDISTSPAAEIPDTPPAPPPHRTPSPAPIKGKKTPKLGPSPSGAEDLRRRRSSSPLKHQYQPSIESDSSSASEDSGSEHSNDSSFSSPSDEEDLEGGDVPTPLLPTGALHRFSKSSPKGSIYSMPNGTIAPSQSASQAPYHQVPPQPMKASKTIASIYSWSDAGRWDQLHPDECSIVITPGLIEAYEMSAAHSKPVGDGSDAEMGSPFQQHGERPLIGLELTPLVPLRRGTALDISIRSPPTSNSQLTTGNNIMFRSRNPEECEALYGLINTSRINNPTYIALQNARGPYGDGFGPGNRRGSSRRSSWWGFGRKNSYRASSARASSVAISDSSIGSLSSAFSALRRFGNGGRTFNISKSTVGSREGSRANSVYSSSSNSSLARGGADTPPDLSKGSPIGLTNAKIRIYQRETASKWRDMGSARLSITRPPPGFDRYGLVGNEKRILVKGKTADEVLLDVCLGESCFERVARTGIALSVWEEVVGPNGEIGQVGAVGGVGGKTRVYMIQMKSEAETAYTYSLVGKLRY